MSDDGKLLDDLGDLDWDSALDEWEKNTFVPEVARDAETNRAAGASQGSLKDVSSEGTVIAPVPRELRAEPRRIQSSIPPLVTPPPQRGSGAPGALTAPTTTRGAAARGGLGDGDLVVRRRALAHERKQRASCAVHVEGPGRRPRARASPWSTTCARREASRAPRQ